MNWRLQQIRDLWQRATKALSVAERSRALAFRASVV
jgi:hypothetical protein